MLEVCLPTSEEQQPGANKESLLTSIRGPRPVRSKEGSPEPRGGRNVEDAEMEGGLLSNLREVQCLICCLLHQMFIADPNIAKLVHFQVGQRGGGRAGAGCSLDPGWFSTQCERDAVDTLPKNNSYCGRW